MLRHHRNCLQQRSSACKPQPVFPAVRILLGAACPSQRAGAGRQAIAYVAAAVPEAADSESPSPSPSPSSSSSSSSSSNGLSFSDSELRQMWDSTTRALLKLGKMGATASHARSLGELLAAHKLVKVQVNGVKDDSAAVAAVAADLAQQAGEQATLLQVKGSTMLFSSGSSSRDELLAVSEAAAAGTAAWRAKRQAAAEERAQQRAAADAKRDANASRSRKRIGKIITTVSKPSKGPLDKASLAAEWQQLASEIAAEEAAEQGSNSGSKSTKAPWKKKQ